MNEKIEQYVIGIDPGANIGVAIAVDGKLIELKTFYSQNGLEFFKFQAFMIEFLDKAPRVIIENSNLCKKNWQLNPMSTGKNQATSKYVISFFKYHGVKPEEINPTKQRRGVTTKTGKKLFQSVTGWEGSSSEHSRDAGMLLLKYLM